MNLKNIRILSILPIITALLAVGCNVREVHMGLGILTLVFATITALSLFKLKE